MDSTALEELQNGELFFRDDIAVNFKIDIQDELLSVLKEEKPYASRKAFELRYQSEQISLLGDFNTLLCLEHLPKIEKLWYQIETVRKTLRHFNGRVLLADEVGLGKTIEAGMLIKEYILRGLAKKILILTPSSLVSQWREEMKIKFDLDLVTPPQSSSDLEYFWQRENMILSSINFAKSSRNFKLVEKVNFDLVVIDEAHHVKNANSLNWQLVNSLKKRFIFLLTATPLQNDLMELYNLITLLKPGLLSTKSYFKKTFVEKSDAKKPKNREDLRNLLAEVMIRNTRSLVNIGLPRRWAQTFVVEPSQAERELYYSISDLVRKNYQIEDGKSVDRFTLLTLQKEAGSSPQAVHKTLERLNSRLSCEEYFIDKEKIQSLIQVTRMLCENGVSGSAATNAKTKKMLEIIAKDPDKKIIIFVSFRETLKLLSDALSRQNISFREFHGGLSAAQKDSAISDFADNVNILIATETGGEGKNLQFCHTMINYDLPWNPMSIEQRIGRLHRFGQKNEVFIFNLALKNSVENYLLNLLDAKINMFELVIGEMDMILGNLEGEDRDFEDIIMNMWVRQDVEEAFDKFGNDLINAKERYVQSKELDKELFEDDYQL